VKIHLSARVTADNELLPDEAIIKHRHGNRHTARPHFGVHLWVRPSEAPASETEPSLGTGTDTGEPSRGEEPPAVRRYFDMWEDMKNEKFGRAPHMTATYVAALQSVDQQILWDGIRNPSKALSCTQVWPYNGISMDEARRIIGLAEDALSRLRHFVHIEDRSRAGGDISQAISGNWLRAHKLYAGKSRVNKDTFNDFWKNIIEPLMPRLEKLNGVAGKARELCG
jgi:hypothetical protein